MTALQECISYRCDGLTQREVFERLQTLDERIRLRWVVPGKAGSENSIGGTGNTERRVWVRQKNASNVKIEEAGHLVRLAFLSVCRLLFLKFVLVDTDGGAKGAR
jgi:hypothetical protein